LTTILATDVVGYSRLMAADEAGTLAALKTHRRELVAPKTDEYGGRTVKLMGDGTLMEFASVVDAVRFAVDVQRTMVVRNAAVPENRRIIYRMGVNIGDIIVDGDDIYGDGVRRGPPGGALRAGRHLRLPHRFQSRSGQGRYGVRRSGRAGGQKHPEASAGLPRAAGGHC
jgi:hypothetical protein